MSEEGGAGQARAPLPLALAPERPARVTSAVALVVSTFASLALAEQEEAYARIADLRLTRPAEAEGEMATYIRAMPRFADVAGDDLTVDRYRELQRQLLREGGADTRAPAAVDL